MTDQPTEATCLIPGCGKPAACRGLCHQCYAHAAQSVRVGVYTWEQLVARGLALETRRRRPMKVSPWQRAERNLQCQAKTSS